EAPAEPAGEPGHPRALRPALRRHDQRLQALPPPRDRGPRSAALAPLKPDGRAAAEGDRARLSLRRPAQRLARPARRTVEAAPEGDGLALSLHRPLLPDRALAL